MTILVVSIFAVAIAVALWKTIAVPFGRLLAVLDAENGPGPNQAAK